MNGTFQPQALHKPCVRRSKMATKLPATGSEGAVKESKEILDHAAYLGRKGGMNVAKSKAVKPSCGRAKAAKPPAPSSGDSAAAAVS